VTFTTIANNLVMKCSCKGWHSKLLILRFYDDDDDDDVFLLAPTKLESKFTWSQSSLPSSASEIRV
jgi:hypothetical protein